MVALIKIDFNGHPYAYFSLNDNLALTKNLNIHPAEKGQDSYVPTCYQHPRDHWDSPYHG